MDARLEKWQEPAQAKQSKVLPQPDMEPKKWRGGRRFRKMKERYGMTGAPAGLAGAVPAAGYCTAWGIQRCNTSTQEACQGYRKRAAVLHSSGVEAQVRSLAQALQHPNPGWDGVSASMRWPYQPGLCCCVRYGACLGSRHGEAGAVKEASKQASKHRPGCMYRSRTPGHAQPGMPACGGWRLIALLSLVQT